MIRVQVTCPVHILTPLIFQCDSGERLFRGITAAGALEALRAMLTGIGVCEPEKYRTHDLRRGHALDLQLSSEEHARCLLRIASVLRRCMLGAPLWEILAAGEWRSPAFMKYLDLHRLETDVVVQAHMDESDDEDAA